MQRIPADGAKRRKIAEARAIDRAQKQTADQPGRDLRRRQASGIALAANARAADEDGLTHCDGCDQGRTRAPAAVARSTVRSLEAPSTTMTSATPGASTEATT